jgi:hypothetical protein
VIFFVQESAAELPLLILCKHIFSIILFFLTDIVADMAARYTLCAHCINNKQTYKNPSGHYPNEKEFHIYSDIILKACLMFPCALCQRVGG